MVEVSPGQAADGFALAAAGLDVPVPGRRAVLLVLALTATGGVAHPDLVVAATVVGLVGALAFAVVSVVEAVNWVGGAVVAVVFALIELEPEQVVGRLLPVEKSQVELGAAAFDWKIESVADGRGPGPGGSGVELLACNWVGNDEVVPDVDVEGHRVVQAGG